MNKSILLVSISFLMLLFGCTTEGPTAADQIEQDLPNLENKALPPGMSIDEFETMLLSQERVVKNELRKGTSPPSWEDNYGIAMNQYDDDTRNVSLPFSFNFYGQSYNDVWVNSNGHMTFNGPNWSYWDSSPLDNLDGNYGLSWRMIAAAYLDLNPWYAGDVYYNTVGSVGERKFVATWLDVPRYYSSGSNSFQVQLFEGSNQIQLGYAGITLDYYGRTTVGIGAGNGTHLLYATGNDVFALDGTNVCFTPDGNGGYTATAGPCESPILNVMLDIMPDSHNNPVNPKKKGVIPVAILTTDDYDVADIDVESLLLGDAAPAHDGHLEDVDSDGDLDLMLHFKATDIGFDSETEELCVSGMTNAGLELAGCDFIQIVGGKKE